MWKKILVSLPLVGATTWAGGSYYLGSQAQDAYTKLLFQLNEMKPYSFESESYQAGLATSHAVTLVRATSSSDSPVLMRLKHEISHTPLQIQSGAAPAFNPASIVTTIGKSEDDLFGGFIAGLDKYYNGVEPLVLTTSVSFDGSTSNELRINPLDVQEEMLSVSFQGGSATVYGDGQGHFTGQALIEKATLGLGTQFNLSVEPSISEFEVFRVSQALYEGEYQYRLPLIEFSADGVDFALNNAYVKSSSSRENDQFNAAGSMGVQDVSGPLPIQTVDLAVEIEGMSVEGLQAYQELASRIPQFDDGNVIDVSASEILDALVGLFNADGSTSVRLELGNSGGDASANLQVRVIDSLKERGLASYETVGDLLKAFEVQASVVADEMALMQTPAVMFLDHPMVAEFLVHEGSAYRSDLRVSDAMLAINGNYEPLADIVGPMFDMPLQMLTMAE